MAMTPYLAAGGQFLASKFEQHDVRAYCQWKVRYILSLFFLDSSTQLSPIVLVKFIFNHG